MWQKKDLIIQLEIYSVAHNFIWFTQAKLQTICPFWKDISLAKSPYWFGPSQGSIIPNNPEFFEALFSPWLHL